DAIADRDEDTTLPAETKKRRLHPAFIMGAGLLLAGVGIYFGWILNRGSISPGAVDESSRITSLAVLPKPVRRFDIPIQHTFDYFGTYKPFELSRDGTKLVYVGRGANGKRVLFLYDFEQGTNLELPGTHTPYQPFFSPDGESIAFFDNFNLVKVSVHGGTRVILAPIMNSRGGVWGPDGTIVYAANNIDILLGIPSEGGTPTDLTKSASQFTSHRWPQFLPDGKTVLFTSSARNEQSNRGSLFTVSLETGEMKKILDGGFDARYLSSGHLVYAIFGGLMAIPFDLERLETTGTPRRVLDDLRTNNDILFAFYDVSDDGLLTYLPGEAGGSLRQPLWVDLDGREEAIDLEAALFEFPAISPDGSRVAITKGGDIHIFDVSRGSLSRFTFEKAGYNSRSRWSADGTEIFFSSARNRESNSALNIYRKSSDGSGQAVKISTGAPSSYPASLSSDGKTLFFYTTFGSTGVDIWEMPLTGKGEPKPLLQTRFNERGMKLSPDGNWMAYSSDESGHFEVYVRRYPDMSGKWQVSIDGGGYPLWAPDMSALYYRGEGNVMAVDLDTSESFHADRTYPLFEDRFVNHLGYSYDLSPDGKRFLMLKQVDYVANSDGEPLKAVTNWFEELKRLVPVEAN
ncbi:MAG: PD40 domain-containing protein, partial [Candidatus Hydrogenedentes bacterium]|nr:PD40 domain-containing protein [Candidatus Hydrogenedentota bacterium]